MSVLIHDNADKVPPPSPGRHPLTPISGADFERRASGRLPAQAWLIISVAALAPVRLLLWGAYGAVQSALLDHPRLGRRSACCCSWWLALGWWGRPARLVCRPGLPCSTRGSSARGTACRSMWSPRCGSTRRRSRRSSCSWSWPVRPSCSTRT